MIITKYGSFDGDSWENLMQEVFKIKYHDLGYMQMPASPGDYGIEGFTQNGIAFQCYCPDEEYATDELYEKQRDKITTDIGKLKKYKVDLKRRLGSVVIKQWIFLCPIYKHNKLIAHANDQSKRAVAFGLDFISSDFQILLFDPAHYALEINMIKQHAGECIIIDDDIPQYAHFKIDEDDKYQTNINKKNAYRVENDPSRLDVLNGLTFANFAKGSQKMHKIMSDAPVIYERLIRLINQFEEELKEKCILWDKSPKELIEDVKSDLANSIGESFKEISIADRRAIAEYHISRWLAQCPLKFEGMQ